MARVRRPRDKEEVLDCLVDGDRPFDTRYRAMTFAAALGFMLDAREEITDYDPGLSIRWELFKEVRADTLAGMIAFAVTGDLMIVAPDRVDERVEIFEEFANGGLGTIRAELAKGKTPEDAVLDLILAAEDTDGVQGDLKMEALAESFSSDD